ncbi:uncharacterized protein TNCV_1012321 [Trichonephila clavipes]|uniref:Uncharacterized protein n=1 Tax=Trichonephila clavipes TaxID=2585209 RepID=A0A8X6VXC1_TRICX|nr:uncharacterized protein TNCV_1012321 [Trichonephila clavipes]
MCSRPLVELSRPLGDAPHSLRNAARSFFNVNRGKSGKVTEQSPYRHFFAQPFSSTVCSQIHITCACGTTSKRYLKLGDFDDFKFGNYWGLPFRKIGSRVGRNQKTVIRICDRWMQEGTADRRGRSHPPQCTTSPEWFDRKTSIAWSTLDAEPQTSPSPMV